jgi:lysozyme
MVNNLKATIPYLKKGIFIVAGLIIFIFVAAIIIDYLYPRIPLVVVKKPDVVRFDKAGYPITGIDVSRHTGKIDFREIKEHFKDTIDFVYIKATEGVLLIDEKFETNYRNAQQNNIPVGAYHFFKFNLSGTRQAQNFLKTIEHKIFDLPLVLDVEEWSNSGDIQQRKIIKEIRSFIGEMEIRRVEKLMIYTNESGYQKYIQGNFTSNKIWICSLSPQPRTMNNWTLWQHTHNEKLNGAEGWVDINTFNGTRKEWNLFLQNKQLKIAKPL